MKKIIITSALVLTLAIPGLTLARSSNAATPQRGNSENVLTATTSPTVTPSTSPSGDLTVGGKEWKSKLDEYKAAKTAQRLAKLKELGDRLIDNRITLLTSLKSRIQANANIAADLKATLVADIDKNIADLNTLKVKIDADTDLTTLKADVKSIFQTFRTYSVTVPKNLGSAAEKQGMYILGRLQAIERQVQTILSQKKNAGIDTSLIDPLMTQLDEKLADAKTQLETAETQFKAMTPANSDASKTARDAGKAAMKAAKQDLKDAHALLKQIVAKLKELSKTSSSSSPVVSPGTSPAVSPSVSPLASPSTSPLSSPAVSPSVSPVPSPSASL